MTQTGNAHIPTLSIDFGSSYDDQVNASHEALEAQADLVTRLELDLQKAKAALAEMAYDHQQVLNASNAQAESDAVVAYVALKLAERDMDWNDVADSVTAIHQTIGLEWMFRLDNAAERTSGGWDELASLERTTLVALAKGESLQQMVGLL